MCVKNFVDFSEAFGSFRLSCYMVKLREEVVNKHLLGQHWKSKDFCNLSWVSFCFRYWGVLCFQWELCLTVQLSGWCECCSTLDSDESGIPSCPLILPQPGPTGTPEPTLPRQDVTVQGSDLQRKRLTAADRGGSSGWSQIQMSLQHNQREQRLIYRS